MQNQVEQEMLELNSQFSEFLKTKGIKAKFHVIVENIKRGIKETPQKTAQQIANSKPSINNVDKSITKITANDLNKEFNEFLKAKGLSNDYIVEIVEVK